MSAFTIRDALADDLRMYVMGIPIYSEQPDALTPEAVTVEWINSTPAAQNGMMNHVLQLVVWPFTDLTTRGPQSHYVSRDLITTTLIEFLQEWKEPQGSGLIAWSASPETRDLGGQTVRVVTVDCEVTEAYLC